jgi:hypothetical protein
MTAHVTWWPWEYWGGTAARFYLRPFNITSLSLLSGQRPVYGPIWQLWVIEWTSPIRVDREWQEMQALLSKVAGQSGLVRMGDPRRVRPLLNRQVPGTLPSLVTVGEAEAAESDSLLISGLPANLSPALHAGDLFEIRPDGTPALHGHLYEVHTDADTDENGETRVTLTRPLLRAVADGAQVVLEQPTTLLRMSDDQQGIAEYMLGAGASISFSAVEQP